MSRTVRRRSARHAYAWVLREHVFISRWYFEWRPIDRHSTEGRRRLAVFHSDSTHYLTHCSNPPRSFRKAHDHQLRTHNDAELRRALYDPGYDPVFLTNHRHSARWAWD